MTTRADLIEKIVDEMVASLGPPEPGYTLNVNRPRLAEWAETMLAAIHEAGLAVVPRKLDADLHVRLMVHADVRALVAEAFPAMVSAADLARPPKDEE